MFVPLGGFNNINNIYNLYCAANCLFNYDVKGKWKNLIFKCKLTKDSSKILCHYLIKPNLIK